MNDSKRKILLAEDDPEIAHLFHLAMTRKGWEVLTAENGERAFQIYLESTVDCVVMDLQMPFMDGVTTTDRIREHERDTGITKPIPILAVTAHAGRRVQEECQRAGVTGFINKPVRIGTFISEIEKHISHSERS